MPIVFFFYPETAGRSLESIDAMFSTRSPLYSKMEAAYMAAGNGDFLGARSESKTGPLDSDGNQIEQSHSPSHSEQR